ncbi:hypothetical protein IE81DRAFT_30848 [Ceraceosorus guamensis]|uniref:Uncharacterized protein n=1 Tax=Ceraceosorus guamensis TaxID=1522189 RepID=A0A316W6I1_9BASI|nr:hypothetical protein IE81DRAFT_30848 [Ceraceosorus guamensis]PWN44351.1 hypothetical protein IE81DRAFT_30848 [Ceraceosorus guamensis]
MERSGGACGIYTLHGSSAEGVERTSHESQWRRRAADGERHVERGAFKIGDCDCSATSSTADTALNCASAISLRIDTTSTSRTYYYKGFRADRSSGAAQERTR